jgi:hypothetical protein
MKTSILTLGLLAIAALSGCAPMQPLTHEQAQFALQALRAQQQQQQSQQQFWYQQQMEAIRANQPRPAINCTSQLIGNQVYTTCR